MRNTYVRNILLPCLLYSSVAGIFTGVLIFLFKFAADRVIRLSSFLYATVRENPTLLPLLLLGAAILGLAAGLILKFVPDCRGGGIPTAIAILRGLISFRWLRSILGVFTSAMLTYLGGVPLGNEGPSVQMGAAAGRGAVRMFARREPAWDRYIMTGGACAGFAAATGSPLSGVFFAFEEAHRRFSPMIFMSAATAVIAGSTVMQALCSCSGTDFALFRLEIGAVLPLSCLWAPIAVGLVVGFAAAAFTGVYRRILRRVRQLSAVPFVLKIVVIFVGVAAIGFFSADCLGSGHSIVESLVEGDGVWFSLIFVFVVRALLLMIANNTGVTGGLFVPTLAFGAMIGALCARAMCAAHLLPEEYYPVLVVVGIASFLSASSRIPITAIAFSVEALGGLTNILPITAGVTIAYIVVETLGVTAFTDTVIEGKVEERNRGKQMQVVNVRLTVSESAFVVGKEIRDILWPPTCVVLSVQKHGETAVGITAGDILRVRYQTFDPAETMAELEALVGRQEHPENVRMRTAAEGEEVPEL